MARGVKPAPALPNGDLQEARCLANAGRLAEALTICDQLIAVDPLSAPSHYLRGIILHEQNAIQKAVLAIRRALYLDHDFIVAHLELGNLMLRLERKRDARRCFGNARALLLPLAAEALLPESDGIPAAHLLSVLTSMQELIT